MRNLISAFALCSSLLVCSCAKELPVDMERTTTFTVEQGFDEDVDSVKTELGVKTSGKYTVNWKKGDKIVVNGITSKELASDPAAGQPVTFTVSGSVCAPYQATYPASAYVSRGKVRFPQVQKYTSGKFDPAAAVMTAQNSTQSLSMKFACAFIKLTMNRSGSSEVLSELKLYSNGGESMSGEFMTGYATTAPFENSDGLDCVVMNAANGLKYDSSGKIIAIFAVPAAKYSKGFTILVETSDGKHMKKSAYATSGITLNEASLLTMPAFTFSAQATSGFSGGTGTSEDPYLIGTAGDLKRLSTLSNGSSSANYTGKYYSQIADIDMAGVAFTPICKTSDKEFKGLYEGNGHAISNLTISETATNAGLFGYFGLLNGSVSKLRNLTLRNCSITSTAECTGGFVGYMYFGTLKNCVLEKTSVKGTNFTGGVVGKIYRGSVLNCSTDVSSSVSGGNYVGGIAGGSSAGLYSIYEFSGCENCAGVSTGTGYAVGGIVGGCSNISGTYGLSLTDCVSYGDISGKGRFVGGIVGYVDSKSSSLPTGSMLNVQKCAAYCNINGTFCLGGILGYAKGGAAGSSLTFKDCGFGGELNSSANAKAENAGGVITNRACVGGVFGFVYLQSGLAKVANCFSKIEKLTTVSTTSDGNAAQYSVGGIFGTLHASDATVASFDLASCYSTFAKKNFLIDGVMAASQTTNYGGIFGAFTNAETAGISSLRSGWYSSIAYRSGASNYTPLVNNLTTYSSASTLLSDLNTTSTAEGCTAWVAGADTWPIVTGLENLKGRKVKVDVAESNPLVEKIKKGVAFTPTLAKKFSIDSYTLDGAKYYVMQGMTCDDEFLYFCYNTKPTDGSATKTLIYKYRVEPFELVSKSEPLALGHANDMAYDYYRKQLLVAPMEGANKAIIVNNNLKISSTCTFENYGNVTWCMGCQKSTGNFYLGLSVFDNNRKLLMSGTEQSATGLVGQGMCVDENYVYLVRSCETAGNNHAIMVYDAKTLKYVMSLTFPYLDIEPESMCCLNGKYYLNCIRYNDKRWILGGAIYEVTP